MRTFLMGLRGRPRTEQQFAQAGGSTNEVSYGTQRVFAYRHGYWRANYGAARYYFDTDNLGPVPNNKFSSTGTTIAYNTNAIVPIDFVDIGNFASVNTHRRGWFFTSNLPLTPANRKILFDLHWYFVYSLAVYIQGSGTQASSVTSNMVAGALTIKLYQFPNLRHLLLYNAFVTSLFLDYRDTNTRMTVFYFSHTGLSPGTVTITGRLPSSITRFDVAWNNVQVNGINALVAMCPLINNLQFTYQNSKDSPINSTTLVGTYNISHLTNLVYFRLSNGLGITSFTWCPAHSLWQYFQFSNVSTAIGNAVPIDIIEGALASPNLQAFDFSNCKKVITRNITNSDVKNTWQKMSIFENTWTGSINITDAKPNCTLFQTGNLSLRTGDQLNNHAQVDISGLTNLDFLDLCGSNVDNLQLPTFSANMQFLYLFGNKLDIVTNSDLVTKIQGGTSLQDIKLSDGVGIGQTSVNGLGAAPNFAALSALSILQIASCKLTGTLTLPTVTNRITTLIISNNVGLTSVANFLSHDTINSLYCWDTQNLDLNVSQQTQLRSWQFYRSGITVINLAAITATSTRGPMLGHTCANLTIISFPTVNGRWIQGSGGNGEIQGYNCPLLSSIVRPENAGYTALSGTNSNTFYFYGCSLNQTFPFGTNSLVPRVIQLHNNLMSVANLDATINNIYTNRALWNAYTAAKSATFGGTGNGIPTGTYAAPPGYGVGVDGTPTSAKEQVYVLVNHYSWTITMN